MTRRPPRPPLFPSTTLFRSPAGRAGGGQGRGASHRHHAADDLHRTSDAHGTLLPRGAGRATGDRKSTRLNSSHANISYAVFCLKKKKAIKYSTRSEARLPTA